MRRVFEGILICLIVLLCFPLTVVEEEKEAKAADSVPVHNLSTGLNYTTIQGAIDAPETSQYNTIEVDAGVYYERLIVDKPITLLGEDRNATIIDGNGGGPVISIVSNYVTISNFTVRNAGRTNFNENRNPSACIKQFASLLHDIRIENNVMSNAVWGVLMVGSDSSSISNNIISDIVFAAIDLGSPYNLVNRNITISGNLIFDFQSFGIMIDGDTQNSIIANNTVRNGYCGIVSGSNVGSLISPSNNLLDGNVLEDSVGVNLLLYSREGDSQESYTNIFRRNSLINTAHYNFAIWGYNVSSFIQDMDNTNMVNGKRVYYLTNLSGAQIDPVTCPDAGYLALVNCTNSVVRDIDLSGNNDGLLLAGTNSCILTNITLENNHLPVLFPSSESYPKVYGGLGFFESYNNSITNSRFCNDSYGVGLYHSDCNVFYHNNFISNGRDVISDYSGPFLNASSGYVSNNTWDDGQDGNYWSSYNGTDTDRDGVGDTPHVIDANSTDSHPLMGTFSEFYLNFTDESSRVTIVTNSTVSHMQLFIWNGSTIQGLNSDQLCIQFFVSVENGTAGFCRLMVPTILLNSSSFIVLVDFQPVNATKLPISRDNCTFLYFTFPSSRHEVLVTIPELHSFIGVFFILSITLAFWASRKDTQRTETD